MLNLLLINLWANMHQKTMSLKHLMVVLLLMWCAEMHIVCAQTHSQAENDSFSSTTATTCELDGSACGLTENYVTSETLTSSPVHSVALSSTQPSAGTDTIEKSVASSTAKPNVLNATSSPPASKPPTIHPMFDTPPPNDGICSCDLMAFSCDINCCCDPDCSTFERTSFSECYQPKQLPYENRFCHATKLLFLNNSDHIIQQTENGMFCIVWSNVAGLVTYPHQSGVFSSQEFSRLWDLSHSSSWPIIQPEKPFKADSSDYYIAGAPLWIIKENRIQPYDIPASGLTYVCSRSKGILFLQSWSTRCIRKVPQTPSQCEHIGLSLYQDLYNVVQSPSALNFSLLPFSSSSKCPLNVCTPVQTRVCSTLANFRKRSENCQIVPKAALQNMSYTSSDTCHGAVKNLRFVFSHNGTEGIKKITAYFLLANVSMKTNLPHFHQEFLVEFEWALPNVSQRNFVNNSADQMNTSTPITDMLSFPRSGNPGYIVGKPVPMGFKIKMNIKTNKSEEANEENTGTAGRINLSPHPHNWLSVPHADKNGYCCLIGDTCKRTPVTFGEDLHLSCSVQITQRNLSSEAACDSLRERILHILLGDVETIKSSSPLSNWNRVIAAFGNANTSNPQEWVPLILDILPSSFLLHSGKIDSSSQQSPDMGGHVCKYIPLGIHLRIMYALVGTAANPQAKIVGALLRLDPVRDVSRDCSPPVCVRRLHREAEAALLLHVTSSVIFVDVSSPAVTRFAEPPAVHIRLPPDFFYPFRSSAGPFSARGPLLSSACVLLSFVFAP